MSALNEPIRAVKRVVNNNPGLYRCLYSLATLNLDYSRQLLNRRKYPSKYGSQQAVHQDTAFVRMNSPFKLAAARIALEDVEPGCGELVYYPGSHHWPDFLFSDRFKHYNKIRDGAEALDEWYRWIHEEAARRGTEMVAFRAKKGDVLLWHAGLAHGGAPISEPSASRLSLVGHYCPRGVRPLYHLYKFSHRKLYRARDQLYCSSYYRR